MTWTAGVVRQGISGDPTRHRTTPELCPFFFHPPATYNPWMDRTWCLCGRKTYPGDHATLIACEYGALTEITPEYIEWDQKRQEGP